jgi:hypothetical protein
MMLPDGTLPEALHELIEWEIEVAYHQGYQAALADVAARQAELDAAWRPVGRRRHARAVAARVAEMEQHARQLRAELDRDTSHGDGDRSWPPVAGGELPTAA